MTQRICASAAAAVAMAALAAGVSSATAPGSDGQIAFSRYDLHDAPYTARLLVAESNGEDEQTITHPPSGVVDDQPDWSPDGSHLLFQRCRANGPCSIWSVRRDGTDLTRLSPRCSGTRCPDDQFPAYSPDGTKIAFTRLVHGGAQAVMVADAGLRHARRTSQGYEPAWSPDGKHIVFVAKSGTFQAVFVADANGTRLRRLTPLRLRAGNHPDWSPDGARIVFASGPFGRGDIYSIRPDGSDVRRLTHFSGASKVSVGSYSPDGDSIVFGTVVGAVNPPGATLNDIFVMTANGTDIRPVTRTRNWDGSADWGPGATR